MLVTSGMAVEPVPTTIVTVPPGGSVAPDVGRSDRRRRPCRHWRSRRARWRSARPLRRAALGLRRASCRAAAEPRHARGVASAAASGWAVPASDWAAGPATASAARRRRGLGCRRRLGVGVAAGAVGATAAGLAVGRGDAGRSAARRRGVGVGRDDALAVERRQSEEASPERDQDGGHRQQQASTPPPAPRARRGRAVRAGRDGCGGRRTAAAVLRGWRARGHGWRARGRCGGCACRRTEPLRLSPAAAVAGCAPRSSAAISAALAKRCSGDLASARMMIRSRSGARRAIQRARRGGRLLDVRQRDGQVGIALERHAPGRHLVQHGAQPVDVRLRRRRPTTHQLGRQVVHRAHDRAGARQPARCHRLGDAEVGQARPPVLAEQHVLGFDVAVDQPACVRVVERGRQRGADRADLCRPAAARQRRMRSLRLPPSTSSMTMNGVRVSASSPTS